MKQNSIARIVRRRAIKISGTGLTVSTILFFLVVVLLAATLGMKVNEKVEDAEHRAASGKSHIQP